MSLFFSSLSSLPLSSLYVPVLDLASGEKKTQKRGEKTQKRGKKLSQLLPVPHPVVAPAAAVEVPAVGPVPHVDAVVRVLRGVRVHDVHQDHQAEAVRLVDHRLEFVGRAAARRRLKWSLKKWLSKRSVYRVFSPSESDSKESIRRSRG